jgi:hypothetical protein
MGEYSSSPMAGDDLKLKSRLVMRAAFLFAPQLADLIIHLHWRRMTTSPTASTNL